MKPYTRRQLEVMYAFICQHQRQTNRPPTIREIAEALFMSPGTILRYLDKMEALGWITREWGKARGIMLRRSCTPEEMQDTE